MLYNTDIEQKVYDKKHQKFKIRLLEEHDIVLEEWTKVIGLSTGIRHSILEAKCFGLRHLETKKDKRQYGLKIINEKVVHLFTRGG